MSRNQIGRCFVVSLLCVAGWTQLAQGDSGSLHFNIRGKGVFTRTPDGPTFSQGVIKGGGLLHGTADFYLLSGDDTGFTGLTVITNVHGSITLFAVGVVSESTNTFTNDSVVIDGTGLFEGASGEFTFDGVIIPQDSGPDVLKADLLGTLIINSIPPN